MPTLVADFHSFFAREKLKQLKSIGMCRFLEYVLHMVHYANRLKLQSDRKTSINFSNSFVFFYKLESILSLQSNLWPISIHFNFESAFKRFNAQVANRSTI